MPLIAVTGRFGSGKTLFMTMVGALDYKAGRTVYSNYDLYFPKSTKGNQVVDVDADMLFEALKSSMFNGTVLLDEIWTFLEARRSSSKQNVKFSQLLMQSRKRHVQIYGTMQHIMQVDNRFRNFIDAEIQCRMRNDYLTFDVIEPRTGIRLSRHGIDATQVYDLYDTNQIIDPSKFSIDKVRTKPKMGA